MLTSLWLRSLSKPHAFKYSNSAFLQVKYLSSVSVLQLRSWAMTPEEVILVTTIKRSITTWHKAKKGKVLLLLG